MSQSKNHVLAHDEAHARYTRLQFLGSLLLLLGLVFTVHTARAQSAGQNDFSLEGGIATNNIDVGGLRVGRALGTWDALSCATFGEADLEYWRADRNTVSPDSLTTVGALAGCRFSWGRVSPEVGIGVRLLSHVEIVRDEGYSTAFQFQEMLGLRFQLDDQNRYFLSVRARHVSNGAIKHPNAGSDALLLSVGTTF